jgi:hypothetical protein
MAPNKAKKTHDRALSNRSVTTLRNEGVVREER